MALTASTLTESLPSLPALPSAAALSATSRAALKDLSDLSLPKLDLDRLDPLTRDLPRELPFDLRWPRLSRRRRRQLARNRRLVGRTIDRTVDRVLDRTPARTLERTLDRNREVVERGARALRHTGHDLAASRPWRTPSFTEQLIDVGAHLVAPGADDPPPLAVVLDTVGDVTDAVRASVADQVAATGDATRSRWRQLVRPLDSSPGSLWSSHSAYSALSSHSLLSFGSALSVLSAGSILSIGSAGSILSIGSVGSVLCIGSAGSVLKIGGAGHDGLSAAHDHPTAAPNAALLSSATRVVRLSAGVLGACAIATTALRD